MSLKTVLDRLRGRVDRIVPPERTPTAPDVVAGTPWWPEHFGVDDRGEPITQADLSDAARPELLTTRTTFRSPRIVEAFPDRGDDYDHLASDAGVAPDPIWLRAQYPVRLVFADGDTAMRAATEFGGAATFIQPGGVDLPVEFSAMIGEARLPAKPIRVELRWHAPKHFDELTLLAEEAGYPKPVYA